MAILTKSPLLSGVDRQVVRPQHIRAKVEMPNRSDPGAGARSAAFAARVADVPISIVVQLAGFSDRAR